MSPDEQDVFFTLIVGGGPGAGEFIYDGNGNLREAGVGQTTTDPVHGITCQAGRSFFNTFGAVLVLISDANDAIFQYFDNGSAVQGSLVFIGASAGGTDPVTNSAYLAGQSIRNPVFGDSLNITGATIDFGLLFSQKGRVQANQTGGAGNPPYIVLYAPEQGVSGHLVMVMQGTSPDGTKPGQLLIASEPTGFTTPTRQSNALLELLGDAAHTPAFFIQAALSTDAVVASNAAGDTNNRYNRNADGQMSWGPGNAARDIFMSRQAAGILQITSADLDLATIGKGLRIKEGANARMGVATLVAGTVTVANTSVTASTRIFLMCETPGGTPGFLRVSARTAGTSFTILSSSATDTSVVGWLLIEPG